MASLLVLVNVNATNSALHLVTAAVTTQLPVRCPTPTHAQASVELSFKKAKTASAMSAVVTLRAAVRITAKPAQLHPVQNLLTGKSEMTSQNHGFAIDPESNNGSAEVTHVNLNDNTVEGIRVTGKNAFAVQYHPEASPGPHDSRYLFDDFVAMMG